MSNRQKSIFCVKSSHFRALAAFLGLGSCLLAFVAGCGVWYANSDFFYQVEPVNSPIRHVVVIMQENRTFDNLFNGFPGADSAASGMSHGRLIPLSPVHLADTVDMHHSHVEWWKAWNSGTMDGFAQPDAQFPLYAYSFVPEQDIEPYWSMARNYTLADRMFQSNSGSSFPAHQYMIAGQSALASENPTGRDWGCGAAPDTKVALIGPNGTDSPGVFPCFDYLTLGDLLDKAKISWRYYAPASGTSGAVFSAYEAIRHIFSGRDWARNVMSPQTRVLSDIAQGKLAQVTWIVPDWSHSDHPGNSSNEGPDWVASIVNAIGTSKFWDSTAIFITWDDWGGWYDHVPPTEIDEMGPGFRVPLIVISPYAKHAYVSHHIYETASLLTYVEKNFGLEPLGTRDATAGDLLDCFDYSQPAAPFVSFPTRVTVDQILQEPPSGVPDND